MQSHTSLKSDLKADTQVAGQAGAAGVAAGLGAVLGEVLEGASAEALVGALAEALKGQSARDRSLARRGGWSLGRGNRQTKGKSLPMERQSLMGRLGASPV